MNLTDDEATILMVDININQRRKMLLSEKAFDYKMKLDAIKHQEKKEDETSRLIGEKLKKIFSADIIGKEVGESARTIQRYVRLTYLIPELLELVDKETNGMGLYPAVEISYISQENQKLIYGTKDYHRKRLKVLENEKYIRRVNSLYIKLDVKGTKLVKTFGYDYNNYCRTKEYIGRLNEIAKIAAITQ